MAGQDHFVVDSKLLWNKIMVRLTKSRSTLRHSELALLASIDNEQLSAGLGIGTVGFRVIRNLIAHSRFKDKNTTVVQFCMKLAFKAQQNMPFRAPVIGQIARRVLNNTNPNIIKTLCSPVGNPRFPRCSVGSICDQSVVPNGMFFMSILLPLFFNVIG
ncbi:hypothetical protein BCS7_07965 [Pectobacterium odoriferum]|nr:hypothetical protein BCS7_07965 [Pectobacterium odoriferum]